LPVVAASAAVEASPCPLPDELAEDDDLADLPAPDLPAAPLFGEAAEFALALESSPFAAEPDLLADVPVDECLVVEAECLLAEGAAAL